MPVNEYKSVKNYAENEIIIERSRFIGYCSTVSGEEEAKAFVNKIRKENSLATHNCFAYVADDSGNNVKFSDDGEPSGTAGTPILEVIKNKNLRKCAVVVTRYFGGVKLGAGGLVRAYTRAAAEVLNKAGEVLNELSCIYEIKLSYEGYSAFSKYISDKKTLILNSDFNENVTVTVAVPESRKEIFEKETADYFSGKVILKKIKSEFMIFGADEK